MIKTSATNRDHLLQEAEDQLVRGRLVQKGDLIVVAFGEPIARRAAPTP